MKTTVNGKTLGTPIEIDAIKKITSVGVEFENENKNRSTEITLDKDFTFDAGFIPAIIKKMESVNATEGTTSFEGCRSLLGYDLKIYLKSPNYKPTLRRHLKNLLTRWKIIE